MKIFYIFLLYIFVNQFTCGQDSAMIDTTTGRLDIEIEKIISDPYYILVAKKGTYVKLEKPDIIILNPDWTSSVDILTEDEKKKECGYEGKKVLILVTLKQNRLDDYLRCLQHSQMLRQF